MNSTAYGMGHNAYHDGKRLRHNPFKRASEDWEEWRMGWGDEKRDDPYWDKKSKIKPTNPPPLNRGGIFHQ